jgi:hypothetical protein
LDPKQASHFCGDFSAAQEAVITEVSPGCASSAITAWAIWSDFTSGLGLDPFLQAFADKISFLKIFAIQVRCRELSASGSAFQAQLAEDYIRHVAQMYLNVGAKDPHLNSANQMTSGYNV